MNSPKKNDVPEQLKTRHVFLDTQVYHALGHSPSNRALTLLQELTESHRIVLHTTDITLAEVARQIKDKVDSKHRELGALEKHFKNWRSGAPEGLPEGEFSFDADKVANALTQQFNQFITGDCRAKYHSAAQQTAEAVLSDYFHRRPPFESPGSKEFPDALTLKSLGDWCEANDSQMYIVTEDKAFADAARAKPSLFLHLTSIHQILGAAADLGDEGEQVAERAMNQPYFDATFEQKLSEEVAEAQFIYIGDLPNGDAFTPRLIQIINVSYESAVAMSEKLVVVTALVDAEVEVDLEYENRSEGWYDSEDNVWSGSKYQSLPLAEEVEFRVLVEIERDTGKVRETKLINREIKLYHSSY